MDVVVAVVTHKAEQVLPRARLLVVHIVLYLVYDDGCLVSGAGGNASYGGIGLVAGNHIATLAIVEHAEVVVAHIAMSLAVGILTLIAKQEIVGRVALPGWRQHAVVPGTVAQQQQEAGHVVVSLCTVVEHLHIAAIGVSIGCTAGELVEELVGRYDVDAQTVFLFVELLQTFGLCQQLLSGGYDNHHVGSFVGMVVLVRDVIDVFRCGECLVAGRCAVGLLGVCRDIVQPYVRHGAAGCQRHLVGGLQVAHGEGLLGGAHLLVRPYRRNGYLAQLRAVQRHLHAASRARS